MTLPVWAVPPSWADPINEKLEWLTDVLASRSGAEQRIQLRLTPRRTFDMSYQVQGAERTLYDLAIKAAGASDWYVPIWHDIRRTPQALAAGTDFALILDPTDHEYIIGGVCVLYGDLFNYEIVTISALQVWVPATETFVPGLTFAAPVANAWPAGTRFMPVMQGRLSAEPSGTRESDEVSTGTVSFVGTLANPGPDAMELPMYGSYPVLTLPPDESESLSETFQRLTQTLDNKTGLTLEIDTAGFGFSVRQYRWWLKGRREAVALRQLLYALAGRLSPVWVPTFAADLTLTTQINHADTSFIVQRCGYSDFGGPALSGRADVIFQLQDGTTICRGIVSAHVRRFGLTETLTLSSPVGQDLGVSFVKRISFMALCRQNADVVELSHQTDAAGLTTVATTFRDAPDLRAVVGTSGFNINDTIGADWETLGVTLSRPWVTAGGPPYFSAMLSRSLDSHDAGKYYFEGLYTKQIGGIGAVGVGGGAGFGICTAGATWDDLHTALGLNSVTCQLAYPGFVINALGVQTVVNSFAHAFGAFELIIPFCLAIDLDRKLFFVRMPTYTSNPDAVGWNFVGADPVSGDGGIDFSGLGNVEMFICATNATNVGLKWTGNFGVEAFTSAVPTGYEAGWP